ncbi:DNA helicase RecQ [Gluconobacter sphaericus]|uniref:DNA helicase RecQ n=1 Tax=Gluconobacter sphaericus NBRC 12467 TaxID=1307951 RepID=A0AA37SHB8_9PROT|nr:DNA helicase RecQ [Gluconobacter sphaericus]MBF0885380.1 DNA helicase RecQ [Gluconobacter sphaericus]GBR56188.1 ATP-dependent DNA helicase RecQ [Gluconobacter sphaericus NBRC 12467]GEB42043.1 ATP-dependent DNA helicase RecQ [Gluconobacter sphaericus NBRC 12467]GLQ84590.1 ATP-dependent DNA helicase RecQ [Gluconobacter sphaericus NBRC 12467]GLQ85255.1 ATP-dependent DNA helicase RecQ [Gluconobacter sphaericus NBRC 12467]
MTQAQNSPPVAPGLNQPPTPEDVLAEVFGFPGFRGLQQDAVKTVMQGEDVLVLMPTGGGKSLCYQVPALCREGMGLVISPLIALMDDQVAGLRQLGVRAAALHSGLEPDERDELQSDLRNGRIDILYISPERLLQPATANFLSKRQISLIAIDEAHCISAWGHEFRPEYRALASLPEMFPGVPRIALTATADPRTRDDILNALGIPDARVLMASFHRPNLIVEARAKASESRQLLETLQNHREGASIVYCGSRNKTERVATMLRDKGLTALPFHAGLSSVEKRATLMRFRSGEEMVIVATIAFGMGIDRPDVRCVVHLDMPSSPEAYYQQIGRAGRDGEPSDTLLLYGGEDMARARYWLEQSSAPDHEKRVMQARLESMIAITETTGCRTQALLACFGENLTQPCGHCDNCINPVSTFDGTQAAQKVLSAIYRTGQRLGAVQLSNVLRGKLNETIERNAYQHLSVFGIGKEQSEQWWRAVIRQLIARGAIRMHGEYGSLALQSEIARPILRGEERIALRLEARPALTASAGSDGNTENDRLSADEKPYFDALRQWRLSEAREQEIPPYVIFHDSVLRDIAREQPASRTELGSIKGVGASKLDRYGAAVLTVLREIREPASAQ